MKNKVIPYKYLPTKLPVQSTVLYTFLMYYFSAPEFAWGVYFIVMFIVWVLFIVSMKKQKEDESIINK